MVTTSAHASFHPSTKTNTVNNRENKEPQNCLQPATYYQENEEIQTPKSLFEALEESVKSNAPKIFIKKLIKFTTENLKTDLPDFNSQTCDLIIKELKAGLKKGKDPIFLYDFFNISLGLFKELSFQNPGSLTEENKKNLQVMSFFFDHIDDIFNELFNDEEDERPATRRSESSFFGASRRGDSNNSVDNNSSIFPNSRKVKNLKEQLTQEIKKQIKNIEEQKSLVLKFDLKNKIEKIKDNLLKDVSKNLSFSERLERLRIFVKEIFALKQNYLTLALDTISVLLFMEDSRTSLEKIFKYYFSHEDYWYKADDLSVIWQLLCEVSTEEKKESPGSEKDPNFEIFSGAYFFLQALEIKMQSPREDVAAAAAQFSFSLAQQKLRENKYFILEFYTEQNGSLVKKSQADLKTSMESLLKYIKILHQHGKGEQSSEALYKSFAGFSGVTLYNAATDQGALLDKAAASISSDKATQGDVGAVFNGLALSFIAPLFYSGWQSLIKGNSQKIILEKRLASLKLRKLSYGYIAREEDEKLLKKSKQEILAAHFSKYVLRQIRKFYQQSRSFWDKATGSDNTLYASPYQSEFSLYSSESFLPKDFSEFMEDLYLKEFVVHIEASVCFKMLLKNNYSSFEELKEQLDLIEKLFIAKIDPQDAEKGREIYKQALHTLVIKSDDNNIDGVLFRKNKFRGTLFQHLCHKYSDNKEILTKILNYYPLDGEDDELTSPVGSTQEPALDQTLSLDSAQNHLRDLKNYLNKDFYAVAQYIHTQVQSLNWSDRVESCLAMHRFVFIIFKNTLLTPKQKQFFLQGLLDNLRLKEEGPMENLRIRRKHLATKTILPAFALEGFNFKRFDSLAFHSGMPLKDANLSTAEAVSLGAASWSFSGLLNISLEATETTNTAGYDSAKYFLQSALNCLDLNHKLENTVTSNSNATSNEKDACDTIQAFRKKITDLSEGNKLDYKAIEQDLNEFKRTNILNFVLDPLISTLRNKLTESDGKKLLIFYFNKDVLKKSLADNPLMLPFSSADSSNPFPIDELECFRLFLSSELKKVGNSKQKCEILAHKMIAYFLSLENTELSGRCSEIISSLFLDAAKHMDSRFRVLTKRTKNKALCLKAGARILGSAQWGAVSFLASFTKLFSNIGLFLGALAKGFNLIIGIFLTVLSAGLRILSYTLAEILTHSKKTAEFQNIKKMLEGYKISGSDTKTQSKQLNATKKLEQLNKVLRENIKKSNYKLETSSWEEYFVNSGDLEKIKWLNDCSEEYRLPLLQKTMTFILEQGFVSKTSMIEAIVRLVRIVLNVNFSAPKHKIYMLMALFHAIQQGDGVFAILQQEKNFMSSINYGLPQFFGGGIGTAAGTITSILTATSGFSALYSSFAATAGDVLNAYSTGLGNSPKGRTDSYQAASRFLKNILSSLTLSQKKIMEKENPEEWAHINALLEPILDTDLSRLRQNGIGSITKKIGHRAKSYNLYKQHKQQLELISAI